MSVRPRGNSWIVDVKLKGHRVRETLATKDEAEARELEIRAALMRGNDPAADTQAKHQRVGITMGELAERTKKDVWDHKKSGETLSRNGWQVAEIIGKDKPLALLTDDDISRLVDTLKESGVSNATINRKLAALRKMLNHALKKRLTRERYHIEALPEYTGRIRVVSEEEEEGVLKYLKFLGKDDEHDAVVVLRDTGMRVGELRRLQWRDITQANGRTYVTIWESKGDVSRTIPLKQRTVDTLEARRTDETQPHWKIFEFSERGFNTTWDRAREHLGLSEDPEFVPHALRHTVASELVRAGASLPSVMKFMGHKSIRTTMKYAHLAPSDLDSALDLLEAKQ